MKFYVLWSDGRKFGPADIPTLAQWAKEGRINRDTIVENADTGQQARARDIQGMQWPTSAPTTDLGGGDPVLKAGEQPLRTPSTGPVIPGQPQPYVAGRPVDQPQGQQQSQQPTASPYDPLKPQQPTAQQNPYANPPQPGSPYPRGQGGYAHYDDGSQKLITQSWILYALGFFCCCVCTPFGLYSANRAKNMGNQNANAAVIVGWVLLGLQIAGSVIYGILFALGSASGNFP
jgi:hypothetical protein